MRFSLRDAFWCVTLIAAGLGCWTGALYINDHYGDGFEGGPAWAFMTPLALVALSPMLVGAGVGALFRHPFVGAGLGFIAFIWICVFLMA